MQRRYNSRSLTVMVEKIGTTAMSHEKQERNGFDMALKRWSDGLSTKVGRVVMHFSVSFFCGAGAGVGGGGRK